MVKCEVINQDVTIKDFKKLKNIKRLKNNDQIKEFNHFEIGDTFETDDEMAKYLAGETKEQPIVCIKVLEIIPDKIEEKTEIKKKEVKPIAKKNKKVK